VAVLRTADEEVGVAAPAVGDQMGLVDDRDALAHGGQSAGGALGIGTVELEDGGVALPDSLEIPLLVLVAEADRERGLGVVLVRGRPGQLLGAVAAGTLALGEHAVTPGGEVALEEGDQVARRIPEGAVREGDHSRSVTYLKFRGSLKVPIPAALHKVG
jgi:hypothetical protein